MLFICTANQLDPIPAPLLDRMEIIELTGYTEEEKINIAEKYLVPRQILENGIEPIAAKVTSEEEAGKTEVAAEGAVPESQLPEPIPGEPTHRLPA